METIASLREKHALSMLDLANKAGVSLQTVWRLEHGMGNPKPSTRRKLANALGVEPWEIDWARGKSKRT